MQAQNGRRCPDPGASAHTAAVAGAAVATLGLGEATCSGHVGQRGPGASVLSSEPVISYEAALSEAIESAGRELRVLLTSALSRPGRFLFLTGAGISAESGVPTFRGSEGYWRIGSRNYQPRELATRAAFERMPEAVWSWYLHRRRVCAAARPNAAHRAITDAASSLGERFLLITQNVDGLHGRAATPPARTYEIHGNISYMRCSAGCAGLLPVPDLGASSSPALAGELRGRLVCHGCGALTRPHVLWFDEHYDEPYYRFESSLRAASRAALLVVVGTTGTTNLPLQIGELAVRGGAPLVIINPEPSAFSELALRAAQAAQLIGRAGLWLPELARQLRELTGTEHDSGAGRRSPG